MKILALTLLVLGPVVMAFSRPFTADANGALLCIGAVLGMIGLFIRSRVREGIPIFTVTDKEKAQFKAIRQEARCEFSIRKLVGQLLGTFAGLFLVAGLLSIFRPNSAKQADWRVSACLIGFGLLLVLCAVSLTKKRV